MPDHLQLPARHRRVLEALLREHLPKVEVWANGSPVTGVGHDRSDLNLVLRGPGMEEIPADRLRHFEEAMRGSTIPFLVEARDWALLPEHFHREIERDYLVVVGSDEPPRKEDVEQPDNRRGWQAARLGDVVRFVSGGTPSKKREAFWNGAIPWVSAKDMRRFRLRDTMDHVTPEGLANGTRQVPAGTTLLLTRGMRLLKELPVCVVERPMAFNQDVKALLPNARIDPRFLPYLILGNEQRLQDLVDLSGHGTGRINSDELRALDIRLPPTPEQRAIAAVLSDVDELIGSVEALITKKRAIKQAAIQELLTGRTRLPGFRGEWEEVALSEIGKTYGGLTGKTSADFGEGRARYVSFLDVLEQATVTWRRFDHVRVAISELQNRVVRDDVLFNATSETPEDLAMGAMVFFDSDELYLNSFCFGFRIADSNRCDPLFLAYFSRGIPGRKAMYALAQGSTRYNLSKKRFLNLEIDLPPLPEQHAIATILSDMDSEIAALERRLDKTRAIKQGMMQQLLTGSIRLPIPDDDTEDDDAHDA